jgi:DNA-binding Lrp family transcriptional regulator
MKTTTKRIIIKRKTKSKEGLNPAERGVLWYMLETRNREGQFQQHYTDIANAMNSTPPTIHRHIKALIEKGAVEVVAKSHRGHDGYPVPAILRPIPPVEPAYSIYGTGGVKTNETEKNPRKMEQVQAIEIKSPGPIPIQQKPVPNGTQMLTTNSVLSSLSVESGEHTAVTVAAEKMESAPRPLSLDERKQALRDEVRRNRMAKVEGAR